MKYLKKINESNLNSDIEDYLLDLNDNGFKIEFNKVENSKNSFLLIRIWKPKSPSCSYSYGSSISFNTEEINNDVIRAFLLLESDHDINVEYIYTMQESGAGYTRKTWSLNELLYSEIKCEKTKCLVISIINS
jgi:hypothetical protein